MCPHYPINYSRLLVGKATPWFEKLTTFIVYSYNVMIGTQVMSGICISIAADSTAVHPPRNLTIMCSSISQLQRIVPSFVWFLWESSQDAENRYQRGIRWIWNDIDLFRFVILRYHCDQYGSCRCASKLRIVLCGSNPCLSEMGRPRKIAEKKRNSIRDIMTKFIRRRLETRHSAQIAFQI